MQSLRVTGFQIPAGLASLVAGFIIVDYGYGATFAIAGSARLTSALVLLLVFAGKELEKAQGYNVGPGSQRG
jgi:predicted MFS family arabinose efflux permease